jgi:hypothetical protein
MVRIAEITLDKIKIICYNKNVQGNDGTIKRT